MLQEDSGAEFVNDGARQSIKPDIINSGVLFSFTRILTGLYRSVFQSAVYILPAATDRKSIRVFIEGAVGIWYYLIVFYQEIGK